MNAEMLQTLRQVEDLMAPQGWRVFGPGTPQAWGGYEDSIVLTPPCAGMVITRMHPDELVPTSSGGVRVYWRRSVQVVSPGFGPASSTTTDLGEHTGRGWRQRLLVSVEDGCRRWERDNCPLQRRMTALIDATPQDPRPNRPPRLRLVQ